MLGNLIVDTVKSLTKKWAKQRRAEERDSQARLRRNLAFYRSCKVTAKEAAFEVMEEAYLKASNNNTLPAHARQIMYAARGRIQELTGEGLRDSYFTQQLLPDYLQEFPSQTADWDIVFDARGHLYEPHTRKDVPLGTLTVREYLDGVTEPSTAGPTDIVDGLFQTHGPDHRYQAVLFIEKEGFLPLFRRVQLAERHDIALMSTKGQSVTAGRWLIDCLCGEHHIPLLVLHDFDKAGFSILGTLERDTRRYTFSNDINVIDLGLRLDDVLNYDLEAEDFHLKSDPTENLLANGATDDEIEFLKSGKRVELNAFTSNDLVKWIESKLEELRIRKLIPAKPVIEQGYRRTLADRIIKEKMPAVIAAANERADAAELPSELERRVADYLKENRPQPWDSALAAIVGQEN